MANKLERGAKSVEQSLPASEPVSVPERDLAASTSQDSPDPTPVASDAQLEQLIGERIALEVERRFQSAKDKRWSKLEQQFGALNEFQKTLAEGSANPAAETQTQPDVQRADDLFAGKAQALLASTGMLNDPQVQAMVRSDKYAPGAEGYINLLTDITRLALERSQRPRASAASVVMPGGGGVPVPDLGNEYDIRKARLRPGDVNGLMELKREYRQKGLDVF